MHLSPTHFMHSISLCAHRFVQSMAPPPMHSTHGTLYYPQDVFLLPTAPPSIYNTCTFSQHLVLSTTPPLMCTGSYLIYSILLSAATHPVQSMSTYSYITFSFPQYLSPPIAPHASSTSSLYRLLRCMASRPIYRFSYPQHPLYSQCLLLSIALPCIYSTISCPRQIALSIAPFSIHSNSSYVQQPSPCTATPLMQGISSFPKQGVLSIAPSPIYTPPNIHSTSSSPLRLFPVTALCPIQSHSFYAQHLRRSKAPPPCMHSIMLFPQHVFLVSSANGPIHSTLLSIAPPPIQQLVLSTTPVPMHNNWYCLQHLLLSAAPLPSHSASCHAQQITQFFCTSAYPQHLLLFASSAANPAIHSTSNLVLSAATRPIYTPPFRVHITSCFPQHLFLSIISPPTHSDSSSQHRLLLASSYRQHISPFAAPPAPIHSNEFYAQHLSNASYPQHLLPSTPASSYRQHLVRISAARPSIHQAILGAATLHRVCYFNGPLLGSVPVQVNPKAPLWPCDMEVIATFRETQPLARKHPLPEDALAMGGTAAIVGCSFGKGKVVVSSVHLEKPTCPRWERHSRSLAALVAWVAPR